MADTSASSEQEPTEPEEKEEKEGTNKEEEKGAGNEKEEKTEVEYKLELPKDTALSDSATSEVIDYAKANGLSNAAAQEMLEKRDSILKADREERDSALIQDAEDVKVEWSKAISEDKEIGGDNEKEAKILADRALKKFGSEEFSKMLKDTGFDNHPEVRRIFNNIGKAMSDDKLVFGNTAKEGKPRSADVIFGDK